VEHRGAVGVDAPRDALDVGPLGGQRLWRRLSDALLEQPDVDDLGKGSVGREPSELGHHPSGWSRYRVSSTQMTCSSHQTGCDRALSGKYLTGSPVERAKGASGRLRTTTLGAWSSLAGLDVWKRVPRTPQSGDEFRAKVIVERAPGKIGRGPRIGRERRENKRVER
jgi:hypothetical protein